MKDGLDPARGCIAGVLLGLLVWIILGGGVFLLKLWHSGAMR